MRVVMAGGGTGGHLFPGIAVAEELARMSESMEVCFIGTARGIEALIVPMEGYDIKYLRAEGVVGKTLIRTVKAAMKMLLSIIDSYHLLKGMRPDALVGLGGYASFGPVLTGSLMSIPTVIMEQNSVPGFANRFLSRIVDVVCVTYHESISFFPKGKTFITGNPVRRRILTARKTDAHELFGLEKGKFTIFVFGGSSGARKINNTLCGAFTHLHDIRDKIQFLHQTGKDDFETVRETYRKWGFKGTVTAFIHQMPEAYAASDLVISRAGATTLAELTAVGRPAILIPYPYAAGRHQEFNAQRLSEMGAARIILDRDLDSEILSKNIKELYENPGMRTEMERASRALGKPDAAQKVAEIVMSLVKMGDKGGV